MPLFRLFVLSLIISSAYPTLAKPHFNWTSKCAEAYTDLLSLRLDIGMDKLQSIRKSDPENRMVDFLEDYADFFRIYIHEDEEWYLLNQDRKRSRLNKLAEVEEASPFVRYTQAEVHLHWAIGRLKFQEYLGAFADVRRAYKLLEENARLFPQFQPTYKSLSLLQAIVGSIPDKYRWGAHLLGMQGTLTQGARKLRQLAEAGPDENPLFAETKLLYAFLQLHLLKESEEAWLTVSDPSFASDSNLTATFVRVSVAMHTGHNDYALTWLKNAPTGSEYEPFWFLEFLQGLAKLRQLDPSAIQHLQTFLHNFKGRHYRKEACQKMAWAHLIQGDEDGYHKWMERLRDERFAIIDPDKAAKAEAEIEDIPNPLLLKARLLFDGGYYNRGLDLLRGKKASDFDRLRDQMEFTYRAGRLFQALGQMDKAKGYYYATLKVKSDYPYYYPASAAFQLGLLFEAERDAKRARYYFKKCVKSGDHVYESSLDAQAKAGLERLRSASF